jgi:hypothetical protein
VVAQDIYLQPKEQQVMAVFGRADTTMTRQQLVEVVGMPLHCICGRVNSLLTKKVLSVRGFRIDPATRKRQELIGLPRAVARVARL